MVFNTEETAKINSKEWYLSVTGAVEEQLRLSYEEIKTFPRKTIAINILCLRGATIKGNWKGVSAKTVVNKAKPKECAQWVLVKAYSKYYEPIKLEDLYSEEAIIAYSLNEEPIPVEQGGCLRLIIPHKYAYKSVKWLKELEILAAKPTGFWEKRGYPDKDQT